MHNPVNESMSVHEYPHPFPGANSLRIIKAARKDRALGTFRRDLMSSDNETQRLLRKEGRPIVQESNPARMVGFALLILAILACAAMLYFGLRVMFGGAL